MKIKKSNRWRSIMKKKAAFKPKQRQLRRRIARWEPLCSLQYHVHYYFRFCFPLPIRGL